MRLLQLRANKESFKTITFNPNGISIIVGKRHNSDYKANKKSTYNSVGKSLSIALVHYCLGSNKNLEFETKLNDWSFSLDFQIDDENHSITRACNNQQFVNFNGKEIKLDEYRAFLENKVFSLPEPIKYITFRTLISRFIRPRKSSYNSYYKYIDDEQDYPQLLNNSFLLGLNTTLLSTKFGLKEELDNVDSMKKSIEKDPIMKSFFESEDDKDFDIDIVDLKEKIRKLESSIKEFKVAEDYYEIIKEADAIKYQLKSYENKAATIKTAISNIVKSINIQPDIPKKKVLDLYREAEVVLSDAIVRKLEEVEEFNKKILDNRSSRLFKEKKEFETQLKEFESIISRLGKQKDEKLEYLNTRGALDEFTKLNEQLSNYKIRLENIEKYRKLINEYKNKLEEIKKNFIDQNINTNNYLKDEQLLIEKNILLFKSFAEQFYEHKKAGIEIKNNEGINRQRFEIKAKIDDDKGDGVNDVKIFCFDWTILKAKHNHNVNFIFHDSRLLSEIDTRQVASLFQVAYDNTSRDNLQYIISCNQNILDNLKNELPEEEFQKIVANSVVLELTDESDESKLLGIQLDLDYDKE